MFEEETIAVACPNCAHKNSLLIREVESATEAEVTCGHCHRTIKLELEGFHKHLDQVRSELDAIQRDAVAPKKRGASSEDDYQI